MNNTQADYVFLRCDSHRSRRRLESLIGPVRAWYSMSRRAKGGFVRLTWGEWQGLCRKDESFYQWSVVRRPYDDMHPCDDWGATAE